MIVTIYYKDNTKYTFTSDEENIIKIIELLEEKYKDKIGFKIERKKDEPTNYIRYNVPKI